MLKFEGCVFSAAGASKTAKVYGLTLTGAEDVEIRDCTFNGTGYAGLYNKTAGNVEVKNCAFECGNMKNPIEGDSGTAIQGDLTVDNCDFTGVPGNNFINIYQAKDGAVHTISNCRFAGGTANNIIRLSNKNNAAATINVADCSYDYVSGEADEYTGFILCQDYTNTKGTKQDFTLYNVNIDNLDRPEEGTLVYVYEDGKGIIADNYPIVTLDGQPLVRE